MTEEGMINEQRSKSREELLTILEEISVALSGLYGYKFYLKAGKGKKRKSEHPETYSFFHRLIETADTLEEIAGTSNLSSTGNLQELYKELLERGTKQQLIQNITAGQDDLKRLRDITELIAYSCYIQKSTLTEHTEPEASTLDFGETVDFLKRWGYKCETYEQYILARHENLSHTVFVKLAEPSRYRQYDRVKTIILTPRKFKETILRAIVLLFKPSRINASKFNTDVITRFGWHIALNDQKRHEALEASSGFFGEDHILRLLNLLQNEWKNHPTHNVYKNVIKSEYDWFRRTHVEDFVYVAQKSRLIAELNSEYEHTFLRASSSKTRKYKINNWFIIANQLA